MGTSFAERVAQKNCEIVLLAGEDSPEPKNRSVGEASEGEVQVVDEPANTKNTKWPPKSTKSWSAVCHSHKVFWCDAPHKPHCCTEK